jgi:hypothetical protein
MSERLIADVVRDLGYMRRRLTAKDRVLVGEAIEALEMMTDLMMRAVQARRDRQRVQPSSIEITRIDEYEAAAANGQTAIDAVRKPDSAEQMSVD